MWEKAVRSSVNNKDYLVRASCFVSASLHNLTEKPAASSQKHMAEQRRRVVTEIVNTERDYCNDLELCVKHFLAELQSAQVSFLKAMLNFRWPYIENISSNTNGLYFKLRVENAMYWEKVVASFSRNWRYALLVELRSEH